NPRAYDVKHGGAKEVDTSEKACADCHRVRQTDPKPPYRDAGAFENIVLRRGGVFDPTPFFEPEGTP
ncbi:MAG TPA: hypothetical protein VMV18_08085, partial [bacterium]|nr:hypothetical protein [bacterium]